MTSISGRTKEPAVPTAKPVPGRIAAAADDFPPHIRFRPPPELLTPRLYLRPATEADIPMIHSWHMQEETMKYRSHEVSKTVADTEVWWNERFGIDPTTGQRKGEFIYLIHLRDADDVGEAIGTCGSKRAPDLGYQIGAGPKYWGKGYGSEGVGAVVDAVCRTIRENRPEDWEKAYIRIEADNKNIGSLRVAQKVGGKKVKESIYEPTGTLESEFRIYVKDWQEK